MADKKVSDREIERRKQAALKAAETKPHDSPNSKGGAKANFKQPKARIIRHQGR